MAFKNKEYFDGPQPKSQFISNYHQNKLLHWTLAYSFTSFRWFVHWISFALNWISLVSNQQTYIVEHNTLERWYYQIYINERSKKNFTYTLFSFILFRCFLLIPTNDFSIFHLWVCSFKIPIFDIMCLFHYFLFGWDENFHSLFMVNSPPERLSIVNAIHSTCYTNQYSIWLTLNIRKKYFNRVSTNYSTRWFVNKKETDTNRIAYCLYWLLYIIQHIVGRFETLFVSEPIIYYLSTASIFIFRLPHIFVRETDKSFHCFGFFSPMNNSNLFRHFSSWL